ncbi:MAG: hypothetical protein RBS57_14345, partial [Desulforhabdus sp.]|nr:hypothetical protein [Desulforhabdus sp.]
TETTAQLSELAAVALHVGMEALSERPEWCFGRTEKDTWLRIKEECQLVVMGLGKLGGHELNYVSDVDLLFLHAARSDTAAVCSDSAVLLSRFCQRLSRLLSEKVEGDRVFEVDHRLRPLGKDGPLVPSLAAAVDHYLHHGQPWERQMLLKARPVAGDRQLGAIFGRDVRPFVFRRFLDFQALDELRDMRDRIVAEAVRSSPNLQTFDVKLGVGGIREIEFLVQSLQLIYGGRHPQLDEPGTLNCLERLDELGLLPRQAVQELKGAYAFFRRVEHWAQLDQNRQTQKLPQSPEGRSRLAFALGFEGREDLLLGTLDAHCKTVHQHFTALFRSDGNEADADFPATVMEGIQDFDVFESYPSEVWSNVRRHVEGFPGFVQRTLTELLVEFAPAKNSKIAEKMPARLDRYFGQVRKRPGLAKVFHSSAAWVKDFLRGLVQSELIADLMAHHPGLVEGIAVSSGEYLTGEAWQEAGLRLLDRHEKFEEGLEWLRRLKNERLLQLALADLGGRLNYAEIEEELSALADFVVKNTYGRVLQDRGFSQDTPLAVLALGKLGSREMSYLSDLDLVFVYDPPGVSTDLIPVEIVRMVQRFMRMLVTPLNEGPGYAVDARLRPTGNYGPLIVTRRTWLDYYRAQADIWEIQALLRMRPVAGSTQLCTWLQEQANQICFQQRDADAVWQRLCHLRQRMERERAVETEEAIDLKLGTGGLADLEFIVQGNLLVEGYKDPALQVRTVRLAFNQIWPRLLDVDLPLRDLLEAFETLRALEHRSVLYSGRPATRLRSEQFELLKATALWPPLKGRSSVVETWQDLLRLRRRVRNALHHWCSDL